MGTDLRSSQRLTVQVYSFAGALTGSELRARAAATLPEWQFDSLPGERASDGLIGSVGVLPAEAASGVSLLIRGSFVRDGGGAEVTVDRVGRVTFVRSARGTSRVVLSFRCADAATGCTSVSAAQCTVSLRCLEQGFTCGASGLCVEPTLPVSYPGDGGLDGGESVDGSTGRALSAPRPIAPLSTSVASASRPLFRWQNAAGMTAARVELCADRGCARVIERFDVDGDRGRPTRALPRGVAVFWRLRGLGNGEQSSDASAVWQLRSRAVEGARESVSAGVEGDYNGDGYADLAVASSGDATVAPSVAVFNGSAGGVQSAASWRIEGTQGELFGARVAPAGDLDGDGFGDLLVSIPRRRTTEQRGQVRVYFGGLAGLSDARMVSVDAPEPDRDFGEAIAGLGDVDGDGYGDVAIGAFNGPSRPATAHGAVYVYAGSAAGPSSTRRTNIEPAMVDDAFGEFLGAAGDIDGDGYADLLVTGRSAYVPTATSFVALYRGSASGIVTARRWSLTRERNDTMGEPTWMIGDVNGDGLSDFAVTDWFIERVDTFVGAPDADPRLFATIDRRGMGLTRFGESIAAGDLNGDGLSDLALGAAQEDAMGAVSQAGRAWLYVSNGRDAFSEVTGVAFVGSAVQEKLGAALALGDSDGDGRSELCVGAVGAAGAAGAVRCVTLGVAGTSATVSREVTLRGAMMGQRFGAVTAY